jgi:hypothetical protein
MLAIKTLDFIKECIINGDCSDEELQENMTRISIVANKDYINKNDYVNADQAMRILNTKARQRFFKVVKEHGIINHTINNNHIGFKRKEIEELARKLNNN